MGMVTTHTEGRVVTHSSDDAGPIEVVQLPARDAAGDAATAPTTKSPAAADGPSNNTSDGRFDEVEGQVDGSMNEPAKSPPTAREAKRARKAQKPKASKTRR